MTEEYKNKPYSIEGDTNNNIAKPELGDEKTEKCELTPEERKKRRQDKLASAALYLTLTAGISVATYFAAKSGHLDFLPSIHNSTPDDLNGNIQAVSGSFGIFTSGLLTSIFDRSRSKRHVE